VAESEALALAPETGEMLRAVWFDAGPSERGRLLLVAHHLVVDGVSWRILVGDLAQACQGVGLESVGTSFGTWARRLVARAPELADELPLWRSMLGGPSFGLPRGRWTRNATCSARPGGWRCGCRPR
jgi:hypothetical protein